MKLSERMAEWNRAVENADWLLDYSLDTADPQQLFDALQNIGRLGAARLLRVAGEPLGYFRAGEHFPVDRNQRDVVKTKTVRNRKAKAK